MGTSFRLGRDTGHHGLARQSLSRLRESLHNAVCRRDVLRKTNQERERGIEHLSPSTQTPIEREREREEAERKMQKRERAIETRNHTRTQKNILRETGERAGLSL
jgi:hypothetical protein